MLRGCAVYQTVLFWRHHLGTFYEVRSLSQCDNNLTSSSYHISRYTSSNSMLQWNIWVPCNCSRNYKGRCGVLETVGSRNISDSKSCLIASHDVYHLLIQVSNKPAKKQITRRNSKTLLNSFGVQQEGRLHSAVSLKSFKVSQRNLSN